MNLFMLTATNRPMIPNKIKVIWLCNCQLSDLETGGTGSWLGAMARGLLNSGSIELGIVASGPVRQVTRCDYRQVKQWLIPERTQLGRNGLPPTLLVQNIVTAVKEFSPDLVHVWGTESFWGLLITRGLLSYPALLEMQGLKGQIAKVFYGGLTLQEQFRCIGIKELLKCRTMRSDVQDYACWGLREEEIIRGLRFVDVQSSWVASHVKTINPYARLFSVDLALRGPFYNVNRWQLPARATVFCMAAYSSPFKGLHLAIRAISLLKRRIPDIRLRIAGAHNQVGIRQSGYMRWIHRMILKLGLTESIDWLGPLNVDQIVVELKNAGAMVIPTFIENCCTTMQEAMAIGTPVVVSYVGGIPSLGMDEVSCLFFPPGDETICACQLERVLIDQTLALRLSKESRKIALLRNDRQRIIQRQLDIYHQILGEENVANI